MRYFDEIATAKPISVQIGEQLRAAIRTGELGVGSRLPGEIELARQFGVSRPSVREALSALQFAGYIESRRGSGNVVVRANRSDDRPPALSRLKTIDDVLDMFETRLAVEPHAMAIAALDPDPSALERAASLIEGMRLAASEPAFDASTDLSVHRALAATCRNHVLAAQASHLIELAAEPILELARGRAWSSDELPSVWARQHQAVLDAIARGDCVRAAGEAHEHLLSTVANLRQALDVATRQPRLQSLLDRSAGDAPAGLGSGGRW